MTLERQTRLDVKETYEAKRMWIFSAGLGFSGLQTSF